MDWFSTFHFSAPQRIRNLFQKKNFVMSSQEIKAQTLGQEVEGAHEELNDDIIKVELISKLAPTKFFKLFSANI